MDILSLSDIYEILMQCSNSGWNINFVNIEKETKKIKSIGYRYKVYSIGLDNNSGIKQSIRDVILGFIESKIEKSNKLVKFDPEGNKGETIAYFDTDNNVLSDVSELKDTAGSANLKKQLNEYKYYLLKNDTFDDLFIIKKIPNLKKFYAGFFAKVESNNKLNKIEDNIIGFDSNVDLLIYKNICYIFNRSVFLNFFNIEELIEKIVKKELKNVKKAKVLDNYEKFERKLLSNKRLSNKLVGLLNRGADLDNPLSKCQEVEDTISKFDLKVKYSKTGNKITINVDDSEADQVINLLCDFYARSTQNDERGELERKIQ